MTMNENQESINQWCNEHYPGESLKQRFHNLVEETIELGVCLGMTKEEILKTANISYDKSTKDLNKLEKSGGEIADVYISICYLADFLNLKVQNETNEKMSINRQKTIEESRNRHIKKENLGLRNQK